MVEHLVTLRFISFCCPLSRDRLSGCGPSGQVMLCGNEDQRDLLVSGAEQRKHPLGELRGSIEAVDLWARLHIVEGHLTLVHIQVDANLSQLRMMTFHLQAGDSYIRSAVWQPAGPFIDVLKLFYQKASSWWRVMKNTKDGKPATQTWQQSVLLTKLWVLT